MLKPSFLAPLRFLGLACWYGVAMVACSTETTSLGSAGKLDAAPRLDSGFTPLDGALVVDAPMAVDTAAIGDTAGRMDSIVLVDTSKPVDVGEVICVSNGVSYKPGEIITISACGTCACLADGTLGRCTGVCPPDAAPVDAPRDTAAPDAILPTPDAKSADASGLAALCTSTGGQIGESLCCASVSDFPNSCLTGACGCAPTSSHTVASCFCPNGACFDPATGCSGPAGICAFGADQTCNDNPAFSSIHGRCLEGGRCLCTGTYKLLANGKCS